MNNLVNGLKRELEKDSNSIRIKAEISGESWGEIEINSLDKTPITLGTPFENIKFRFQHLLSGSTLIAGPYRLDNHTNKPLHQHFDNLTDFINFPTLNGALLHILGSDYKLLMN